MSAFVIKNANIYDTEKRAFLRGDLPVEDGYILPRGGFVMGSEFIDGEGKYVIPGMVDVHTHGRSNADFTNTDVKDALKMARSYALAGTTTIFGTLATAPYETMLESTRNTAEAAKKTEGVGANIDGIHIEGRYLSLAKRGAHNPKLLSALDVGELDEFAAIIGDLKKRITVAPELEGGEAFVRHAAGLGYSVSIGHSDSTYDQAVKALGWGATSFTHTFNAMKGLHHREPGTVGAALTCEDAYCEVICDGMHLNPAVVKLIYLAKDSKHLCLITDSMMATGCKDGEYEIAGLPVKVVNGLALEEDGTIAGSTLDLLKGVLNFAEFCGISFEEALPYATENPAVMTGIYGVTGSIAPGKRADIVMLGEDKKTLERVWVKGIEIK